jgi:hypothetical protein
MADQDPKALEKTLASEVRGITDSATLPTNPRRVVRTFAMDVARLSGTPVPEPKPAPTPVPPPAKPVAPTPIPKPAAAPSLAATVSEIALPGSDVTVPHLPPLTKEPLPAPKLRPAAPRQISVPTPQSAGEWEHVVQKKEPSFLSKLFWTIFGTKKTGEPVPLYVPATSTLKPPRIEPPAAVSPSEQSFKPADVVAADANEREAVLARLRSRVGTYRPANPAPPVFPTPRPESTTAPRPAWIPPTSPTTPAGPERLHTYTSDFSNHIDTQGASAFSVYAAQADAGQSTAPIVSDTKSFNYSALGYTLAGAVFFIGGSLLLYYGYTYFAGSQPIPIISNAPATLVSGDEQTTVSGNDGALMTALADTAATALPLGNIRIIYFAASATSTDTGGALIQALQLRAPDILLRNLGKNSTVGVVHAGQETRIFFILAASSYERTFAGMLSWEPTMAQDLAELYPAYPTPAPEPVATTTGKAPVAPPTPAKPRFVDEVVQSHDVRALKDAQGRTIFLYGYRDQNTLVIARDETAFGVLLARLSATRAQ